MVFGIAPLEEEPKFTLVSQYAVWRLGPYAAVRLNYVETVYLLEEQTNVEEITASVSGGALDTLQVTAWAALEDPTGRIVSRPDSTALGTILTSTREELTPETYATTFPDGTTSTSLPSGLTEVSRVVNADGTTTVTYSDGTTTSITPATYDLRVTLDRAVSLSSGEPVALVVRLGVGTPAYRMVEGGRSWELRLSGDSSDALGRMQQMLGGAFQAAGEELLAELINELGGQVTLAEVTAAQIASAITSLGARGRSLDSYLSEQAEQLEVDRRAGNLPWLQPKGAAP